MTFVSVKIIGADRVIKRMEGISRRARGAQDEIAEETAKVASSEIRNKIRMAKLVKTGALVRSTRAMKMRNGLWTVKTGGPTAPYAIFLEEGTRKHPISTNPLRHTWRTAPLHPGNISYRFFEEGVRATRNKLSGIVGKHAKKVVGK